MSRLICHNCQTEITGTAYRIDTQLKVTSSDLKDDGKTHSGCWHDAVFCVDCGMLKMARINEAINNKPEEV
jgi:hypothetical protein